MAVQLPSRPAPARITRTVLSLTLDHAATNAQGETIPPVWTLAVNHQLAAANGAHAGWTEADTAEDLTGAERTALRSAIRSIVRRHATALAVTEASL